MLTPIQFLENLKSENIKYGIMTLFNFPYLYRQVAQTKPLHLETPYLYPLNTFKKII